MTHADARPRLRAYADGTLGDDDAEGVRAHIASGCHECLAALFTRPVGLPRVGPPAPVAPTAAAMPHVPGRAGILGVALGGTLLGCLVGVTAMRWGERGSVADEVRMRQLAGEMARLRAERANADLEAQARIDRLEERLAEAERRDEPAPVAGEPRASDGESAWVETILSTQGTRALALDPSAFSAGARGYAVWSPERGIVVISATGLAVEPAPLYRACVTLMDGATVWVGDLTASEQGSLTVSVVLPDGQARRVVGVDLYRDPPGAPALTGRLKP